MDGALYPARRAWKALVSAAGSTSAYPELNLKVEINTREHTTLFGLKTYPFELVNGWQQARTDVVSFEPEELFGTKLRALLQRRQGRDLFDLNEGLKQLGLNAGKVIACFEHYLELAAHLAHRLAFEQLGDKAQAPIHHRTLLPRHNHLPARKAGEVLPMCPVRRVTYLPIRSKDMKRWPSRVRKNFVLARRDGRTHSVQRLGRIARSRLVVRQERQAALAMRRVLGRTAR